MKGLVKTTIRIICNFVDVTYSSWRHLLHLINMLKFDDKKSNCNAVRSDKGPIMVQWNGERRLWQTLEVKFCQ